MVGKQLFLALLGYLSLVGWSAELTSVTDCCKLYYLKRHGVGGSIGKSHIRKKGQSLFITSCNSYNYTSY